MSSFYCPITGKGCERSDCVGATCRLSELGAEWLRMPHPFPMEEGKVNGPSHEVVDALKAIVAEMPGCNPINIDPFWNDTFEADRRAEKLVEAQKQAETLRKKIHRLRSSLKGVLGELAELEKLL